ncbi:hypothetical protein GCM10017596_22480 [Microbacterium keratanolyticum]|uniref:Uncharacterized protein n=1 Tax=Microbacterium keratanolyticum TaxID=67574 RepID=A0A9W6HTB0_9MICO|nr:hypothetical protein GCM10017596_22480 [Microbacterium keratanolyticum]
MSLRIDEFVERLLPFGGLFGVAVERTLRVRILVVNSHVEPFVMLAGHAKETGSDAGSLVDSAQRVLSTA